MITYAIYKNPSDYPGKFVVRRWTLDIPDLIPSGVFDDIESAREIIPVNFFPYGKDPQDDPCIEECFTSIDPKILKRI